MGTSETWPIGLSNLEVPFHLPGKSGVSSHSASLLPSPHLMPCLGFLSENPAIIILQTGEFVLSAPSLLEREALGAGVSR